MTTTSMKMGIVRATSLAALFACAACTTSSERSDLVATKVVRPTNVSGTAGCEFNTATQELVFGSVDPSATTSYLLGLVIENRLASNSTTAPGRINTNDFQVEQVRMDYEFPDPAFQPSIAEHVVPANGLIITGGSGAVGAELFTPDVIGALKAAGSGTIRVLVRAEGRFLDGSSAKSSQYEYVVRTCVGCGPFPPPSACTAPATAHACAVGQDSDSFCE